MPLMSLAPRLKQRHPGNLVSGSNSSVIPQNGGVTATTKRMVVNTMRQLLIFAALLAAQPATAQAGRLVPFDGEGITNLCAAVANPMTELDPYHASILWGYQSYIFHWAGVITTDNESQVSAKIRRFFDGTRSRLVCNQANFNPRNGNIFKLAIARQSKRFIDDVVRWGVDLNQVDVVDGRTVLDYIRDRRAAVGEGSSFGQTLGRYYNKFRTAGAKHASELR